MSSAPTRSTHVSTAAGLGTWKDRPCRSWSWSVARRCEDAIAWYGVRSTWRRRHSCATMLDEVIDAGANSIVLDCRGLEFLDSSGIGVLVAVRKRLGAGGELVIESAPPHVRKVLEITGVAGHLTVR